MNIIRKDIKSAVFRLFNQEIEPNLSRPDYDFGDYSTNVAFELASRLKKSPSLIAQSIKTELEHNPQFSEVNVLNGGFLNFRLKDQEILKLLDFSPKSIFDDKIIVSEYSNPNPFKQLHVGHLFTSIVGDAISNLLSEVSSKVYRVNFGGDIGLHVAINMYAIIQAINDDPSALDKIKPEDRSSWLSKMYVSGYEEYNTNEEAKTKIKKLNKDIYEIAVNNLHDSNLAKIYWTTRDWSYSYFKDFYKHLDISFDKYYPESSVAELGLQIVKDNLGRVFMKSDQAIIFEGSKDGVNTYVFVNSKGVPTYSAKDVGLIFQKKKDFNFDYSVVITGNEQSDYMRTVLTSVSKIDSGLSEHTIHLTHGLVKGFGGAKFSSRLGNAPLAMDLIDETKQAFKKFGDLDNDLKLVKAAIKYSFLKQKYEGDIIYDPKEAVSLEGKSGPYLLYAYVRALKIQNSSDFSKEINTFYKKDFELDQYERKLLFKISEFNDVLELAINGLKPHVLAIYLYELAQNFNVFYENVRVLGDPREEIRIFIISEYLRILKKGLKLLGIDTISKM